ncbi:MAG TPA: phage baseplate assembly protein V [Myxococcota bacterium]|nr:phage baseplate assembly protein V [Myxococcota bacterium]
MTGDTGARRCFGKFRGRVLDNVDADGLGRLLVQVPAVPTAELSWALPCSPYAGPGVGLFALPPIGANVWVEFEEGDPSRPIWTGCFWGPGEVPSPAGDPGVVVLGTPALLVVIDDEEGVTVAVKPAGSADRVFVEINAGGVVIDAAPSLLSVGAAGISLTPAPVVTAVDREGDGRG